MKPDHLAALEAASQAKNFYSHPTLQNLAAAYLDLREKAQASLDAREKEAKAMFAFKVAEDNFSDSRPEGEVLEIALINASKADAALRECLERRDGE